MFLKEYNKKDKDWMKAIRKDQNIATLPVIAQQLFHMNAIALVLDLEKAPVSA